MTTYADRVDIKHRMRQARIAAEMYGNGIESEFTLHLLQRAEYHRRPGVCPRCGAVISRLGHTHIIDHGINGLCCTECEVRE